MAENLMASLVEGLQRSVQNRQALVQKFGFVPHSVLKISRGSLSRRMFIFQQEDVTRRTGSCASQGQKLDFCKSDEAKARQAARKAAGIRTGGGSVMDRKKGNSRLIASIMPAELVHFFARYYSRSGQVYLDPFMGQGIQMQVAHLLGMRYIGYDLCEEFFAYIDKVRQKIGSQAEIHLADSRFPDQVPDGIGDFCFTSPPYWDVEYYGEDPRQLGTGKTYADFLAGMTAVAKAWHPKFKPGAFCVVNVNDFRREGEFYTYHSDCIECFRKSGWKLVDTWIIEGLVGGLPKAFAVQFNLNRQAPKIHEYALVFRR